ncbi:hypothetical protein BBK36DRAFT_1137059 [Trichoderma citrinoviride]|uniref:Uncharacterized protein n=1 Tax=Trichoderma citrinoviride TaxID=58853 RepID=A0A2T4BM98_9HYPO|nr:hypothetical protein BBK36DRAFT_1137059 [Trichoderma citrinoviride]PTB70389.1 hypothetical protein BBK36DRAFT_1137059 [Trichoderma citrinoviride]
MPVTSILQHQRERERLTQPDLDTPMPDHDQGPSMREEMQKVRIRWALAVEQHVQVSLLTETEKAAAVAARWIPPDSSYIEAPPACARQVRRVGESVVHRRFPPMTATIRDDYLRRTTIPDLEHLRCSSIILSSVLPEITILVRSLQMYITSHIVL